MTILERDCKFLGVYGGAIDCFVYVPHLLGNPSDGPIMI